MNLFNDNFNNKYLKYKNKYLQLKNYKGGTNKKENNKTNMILVWYDNDERHFMYDDDFLDDNDGIKNYYEIKDLNKILFDLNTEIFLKYNYINNEWIDALKNQLENILKNKLSVLALEQLEEIKQKHLEEIKQKQQQQELEKLIKEKQQQELEQKQLKEIDNINDINDINDINRLNEIIRRLYNNNDNFNTIVNIISNTPIETFDLTNPLKAYRMHSSSNYYDCLIHSFLNVTCPNFRKLSQKNKDNFADLFRRIILPKIIKSKYLGANEIIINTINIFIADCKRYKHFLSDSDCQLIAKFYDVVIVLIEPPRQDDYGRVLEVGNLVRIPDDTNTYFIYGSGIHFEGISFNTEYEKYPTNNIWYIDYSVAKQIVYSHKKLTMTNQEIECNFQVEDKVIYNNETYFVQKRLFPANGNGKLICDRCEIHKNKNHPNKTDYIEVNITDLRKI